MLELLFHQTVSPLFYHILRAKFTSCNRKIVFVTSLLGHEGMYDSEIVRQYFLSLGKTLPGAKVLFVLSHFTQIPSYPENEYNVTIEKYYFGPKKVKDYYKKYPSSSGASWDIVRHIALFTAIKKMIMPSFYEYICITDLDTLILKNPLKYLFNSNTSHLLHLMEDSFPLMTRYSNDGNYKFFSAWWENRKLISKYSNYTIYEPKIELGSDIGTYRKIALNSGMWLGKKEIVYQGLKMLNELFMKVPFFQHRIDQGGLNYLRISGQLYQYLPEKYWYFHSIKEGLIISCPELIPSSIIDIVSNKVIILHHWTHLSNEILEKYIFK